MDSVQSLLPAVLRRRGLHDQAQAAHVVYLAQEWLISHLPLAFAPHVRAHSFSHGALAITCAHSIAAQECQAILPELTTYLQQTCKLREAPSVRILRV